MEKTLQSKIDLKTKPLGSLGMLEKMAKQIGNIQQTLSPKLERPTMLVFAADHGLADAGVSPCPKEVTYQMVMNFVSGGAAINVFCRQHGFQLQVIDSGVDFDFPSELPIVDYKIARGTKNMLEAPAMTVAQCEMAIEKGREAIRQEHAKGSNVMACGEMGIGNTSAASLLLHRFAGIDIETATGPGAGHQGEGLLKKKAILKEVSQKYDPKTALETLATFGGLEIAMMCGAFLEAKQLGMVILVDGFIATSAFMAAYELDSTVKENAFFCHKSNEGAHQLMLKHLNVEAILDIGLRLGEGTGAALAYPLVQSAVNFLNEMASFEDAGVSTN